MPGRQHGGRPRTLRHSVAGFPVPVPSAVPSARPSASADCVKMTAVQLEQAIDGSGTPEDRERGICKSGPLGQGTARSWRRRRTPRPSRRRPKPAAARPSGQFSHGNYGTTYVADNGRVGQDRGEHRLSRCLTGFSSRFSVPFSLITQRECRRAPRSSPPFALRLSPFAFRPSPFALRPDPCLPPFALFGTEKGRVRHDLARPDRCLRRTSDRG